MTEVTRPHAASRRLRILLLAALAALAALLFGAGTASASGLPAAQTRVGAIHPAVTHIVGVAEHIAAGQHRVRAPSQLQIVSGHCVAAEGLGDDVIVVRGGTSDVPGPGEVFSGSHGSTLEEAASGVPHGQIRTTTAGDIRAGGGTVDVAPELTRSGVLNERHVNICLGAGPCPFGDLMPNPVPKSGRIQ